MPNPGSPCVKLQEGSLNPSKDGVNDVQMGNTDSASESIQPTTEVVMGDAQPVSTSLLTIPQAAPPVASDAPKIAKRETTLVVDEDVILHDRDVFEYLIRHHWTIALPADGKFSSETKI